MAAMRGAEEGAGGGTAPGIGEGWGGGGPMLTLGIDGRACVRGGPPRSIDRVTTTGGTLAAGPRPDGDCAGATG